MKSMTLALFLGVVLSVVSAQFVHNSAAPTLFHDVRDTTGQLSLRYVTDNGITVTETGHYKPVLSVTRAGGNKYVYVKEGSYSFTSPEGQFFKVDYIADENGYRATGAHLPRAPTP